MTAATAHLSFINLLPFEEPGTEAIAAHVERSGHGGWWADRPDSARALLVYSGPERLLRGDPRYLDPAALAPLGRGQFTAPERFLPLLGRTFTHITPWVRTVYVQHTAPRPVSPHLADWVRPLVSSDVPRFERFTARTGASASAPELPHWLTWTWGGHAELAASGFAWGAFLGPYLAAVACGYLVGRRHMDIAVATDPAFRRLDLALACVTAAADAARGAGLTPTWAASRVNLASRALAAAAGFRPVRDEVVYWTGPARAR
ncbi:GNAT family N-acetyltransferase [Kitasatospora sp. NPDC086791]|uniref:GNAT family N-acetyltransferase n=1 Tax=Kitasatospora sp. NPDC086791 TaxID=3155178 RepID=UPI00341A8DBC